jgi:hypothetical protein
VRPSPDWRHADRAREQEEAQAKAEEHVTMPLLAPQPAGEALIGARVRRVAEEFAPSAGTWMRS